MRFVCPQCANHVDIELPNAGEVWFDDRYGWCVDTQGQIEAWCCTAHGKPIRMTPLRDG